MSWTTDLKRSAPMAAFGGAMGFNPKRDRKGEKSFKRRAVSGLKGAAFGGALGLTINRANRNMKSLMYEADDLPPWKPSKPKPGPTRGELLELNDLTKKAAMRYLTAEEMRAFGRGEEGTISKAIELANQDARIDGFTDELQKIAKAKKAMVGAALGGLAGALYTPGGLKSKLVGAGVGALGGAGIEAAGRGAKRAVWTEPRAREHHELYSYQGGGPPSSYNADRF